MKLLIITRSAWDNNNSIGNTLSNFFLELDMKFCNLYCRNQKPNNYLCHNYFQFSEIELLKNILNKNKIGNNFIFNKKQTLIKKEIEPSGSLFESKLYNYFRVRRFFSLIWLRELFWEIGGWKNKKLSKFIREQDPEIIFMPVYDSLFMHKILKYISKLSNAKIVLFHADDYLSISQNVGFFEKKYKEKLRDIIFKSVKLSSLNYCISPLQKQEYTEIFQREFKILQKNGVFNSEIITKIINKPIRIIFTGNITSGRYKTLSKVGEALDQINKNNRLAELIIYSHNQLNLEMKRSLTKDSIKFKGAINNDKVRDVQNSADILLHVESFENKYFEQTRLSFSTKIVDYFERGKCILAVGREDSASINYLNTNDAGYTITDNNNLYNELKKLIESPVIIKTYGKKAWMCGKKNHDKSINSQKLIKDFDTILRIT